MNSSQPFGESQSLSPSPSPSLSSSPSPSPTFLSSSSSPPTITIDTIVMAALSKLLQLAPSLPPSWSSLLKILLLLLALVNIKSLPLTWHFRFYRSLFHHLLRNRSLRPTPAHLFSPVSTTSRSPFYECDLNLHKSNSTYFSDLDIARTHLICHLFKHSLRKRRSMYVALAGVSCLFRREIKPFEKYEVVNRVLGWDGKWVWVVSHFVQLGGKLEKAKDGETPQRKIFASALSKYVFKMGRITVKPEELLNECSLLPPRPVLATEAATQTDEGKMLDGKMLEGKMLEGMTEEELLEQLDATTLLEEKDEYWTWERVEAERVRGCKIAQCMLGLDQLEGEIRGGEEAGLAKVGSFY